MARFADHFSRVAADYARFRPRYPDALFDWLAGLAPGRGLAWDCATGSGQAAVALAERFERVVATDASAEQLASAEAHPRVEYRVAPAESSGLAAASVDLLTVAQALHWFDLPAFYAEADRVLRPGGVLAAWCYGLFRFADPEVQAVLARFHDRVEPYWPPERQLLEAGYRTLDFPFPEDAAPDFAMTEGFDLDRLLGYLGTWSAVKRYREVRGDDPLIAPERELRAVWGDPARRRPVHWPLALRCGRKPLS
jgi:SAM-dependent methyltransferase